MGFENMPYNGNVHLGFAGARQNDICNVDIPLDDELVNTLHRRSRRQLRNMQAASPCTIKLCRMRQVLQVSGSIEEINLVRNQLQGLHGPRKDVSHAVWAELMRTRTTRIEEQEALAQDPPSSIASLQALSGCRIHVERSRCEVRLFGAEESVQKASQLLDALAPLCTEESIACSPDSPAQRTSIMQAFGENHGVLLSNMNGQVAIIGLRKAVAAATQHLRSCLAGEQEWPVAPDEQSSDRENERFCAVISSTTNNDNYQHHPVHATQPVTTMHQRCPARPDQPCQSVPSTCPTCGAGRFCVGCGAPVWQKYGNWMWVPNKSVEGQNETGKAPCMPRMSDLQNQQAPQMMDSSRNPSQGNAFVQQDRLQAARQPNRGGINDQSSFPQQGPSTMMVPMQGLVPQASMMMGQQMQQYLGPTVMAPQSGQPQQQSKGDLDTSYQAGPLFRNQDWIAS